MQTSDKVSIIIPVYNAEKYIEDCILSVCGQAYGNIEILLIDDGSEDKSPEICRKYTGMDSRIRFIQKEHSGVSDTRNKGIREAKGTYITFLDADDLLDKDFVNIMLQMIQKHKNMLIVSDFWYSPRENQVSSGREIGENSIETYENIESVLFVEARGGYACGKLFDRQKILKYNIYFYPEIHVCEDLLFVLEYLVKTKVGLIFVQEPLYFYRQQEESVTHTYNYPKLRTKLEAYENIIKLLEEEVYPPEVVNKFRGVSFKSRIWVCFDYFHYCHEKHIRLDKREIKNNVLNISQRMENMKRKDRITFIFLRKFPSIAYLLWKLKQSFKVR